MKTWGNSNRPNLRHALLLGAAAFCLPGAALAQQTAANDVAVEEVVVTGSSIRGVAPVGSSLIGLSRDVINATAPANTKEMLQAVPQLGNFGANAEQSTPNRWRTAGFQPNIHNLGAYATLTLFNGHRFAPVGGENVFPDPSIIPVIAVQRVEVIADGASAVYGSDAVAGVVNFIYRKNVDGIEAQATYGWNGTRYQKRSVSVIGGHSWGSGNIMAAYEYSDNLSPWQTDIPFLALGGDQRTRGGRDLRTNVCLQPNITANGTAYAYNNGTFTPGRNVCGVLNEQQIIPDGKRHAVLVTGRQALNDRVEVWTELNYSYYDTTRTIGRQALNLTIPSTNPYFRLPAGVTASSISLTRSGLGLFPAGVIEQSSEVMGFTGGIDIDLGGDWKGTVMAHASKTADFNNDPELDLVAAQRLANGTTLATALNPFGQAADNDPAVLAQINNRFEQINDTSQRIRELQAKADGPVFTIPGGEIRAAAGLDFRQDQAIQLQTAGSKAVGITKVRDDNVTRTVMAAFTEVNIPLFSEQNARPGFERLTLSLSGRLDYYDLYGTQFNPKYGAIWEPVRGIALRGSYSTSFAAPNIGLLTTPFTVPRPNSAINLTDVTTGVRLGIVNALNPGGGNKNLTPEEATSKSLGFDFTPEFLPRFRFSTTWYDVEYRNTVYTPSTAEILTIPQFSIYRIINPTQAQIDETLRAYPSQSPIVTGFDAIIWLNAQNIGVRQIGGFDFDVSYSLPTDSFGSFNFAINANHQTKYRQQVVPTAPWNSRIGTFDAPSWKTRYMVNWNYNDLTATLFANYVSDFKNTTVTPNQTVDSYLTWDLTVNYSLAKLREGASIQARVVNLLDEEPPFFDNAGGYYAALASPFGRQFEVTLRAKF